MPFPTRRLFAGRPATHVSEIPPTPDQIPSPRTQQQADKYFRRVANENVLPSRFNRWLSIGGWVVGGGEFWRCLTGEFPRCVGCRSWLHVGGGKPGEAVDLKRLIFVVPQRDYSGFQSCLILSYLLPLRLVALFPMSIAYTICCACLCICQLRIYSNMATHSIERSTLGPAFLNVLQTLKKRHLRNFPVACSYMVLFANFGDKEHVFSPVSRRGLMTINKGHHVVCHLRTQLTGDSCYRYRSAGNSTHIHHPSSTSRNLNSPSWVYHSRIPSGKHQRKRSWQNDRTEIY
jgi:hypothetical protein